MKTTASIVDHFTELVDPRIERNKKHSEPPRLYQRPNLVRGWSYGKAEQVFT